MLVRGVTVASSLRRCNKKQAPILPPASQSSPELGLALVTEFSALVTVTAATLATEVWTERLYPIADGVPNKALAAGVIAAATDVGATTVSFMLASDSFAVVETRTTVGGAVTACGAPDDHVRLVDGGGVVIVWGGGGGRGDGIFFVRSVCRIALSEGAGQRSGCAGD